MPELTHGHATAEDVGTVTLTVLQNGTPGAITGTVAGATATTCSDLLDTVSIVASDTLSLKVVPSGAPHTPMITWSADVE